MGFVSILNKKGGPANVQRSVPTYLLDCNGDRIIEQICKDYPEELKWQFHYLPADVECMEYRRGIYGDIKLREVSESIEAFLEDMKAYQEVEVKKDKLLSPLQKKLWHLEESRIYIKAFTNLYKELEKAPLASQGMQEFKEYLASVVKGERFLTLKRQGEEIKSEREAFRITLHYENERIILADFPEQEEDAYEKRLRDVLPEHSAVLSNLFGNEVEFSSLEKGLIEVLIKKQPAFFKKVADFYERWESFWDEPLSLFVKEIRLYLAVWKFQQRMMERGYHFATPVSTGVGGEFRATKVYDLALALAKGEEQAIISNDVEYRQGEQFLVVTGPNQGGKTTYARSLGQLLFFFLMGLDVPADEAHLPYFERIMTHFSVEESVETGRGKLMDELVRLAPMLKQEARNAFVIINELFTTAANYDAIEMGTRTLRAFLEKGDYGIYVTHLGELAGMDERVVSMMALLNEEGKQSFRVERKEATELSCAIMQVEKHRLSYEQIKERLACW